jgi:nickel transport protein
MMRSALAALLLIAGLPAAAHHVVATAYAIGNTIEGEVGFSNGTMAAQGIVVQVRDANDQLLGETIVSGGGIFKFIATQRTEHRFSADLGAGHVMNVSVPADELPGALPGDLSRGVKVSAPAQASELTPGISHAALEHVVREAVAAQVNPLRRELAQYQERTTMRDVLGGIGYIFGLFGLAGWLHSRRGK